MKRMHLLGIFVLLLWGIDTLSKIFVNHTPQHILWYSSLGLFMTGIALFLQNDFLLTSAFCALFVIEGTWTLDFISHMIFGVSVFGVTDYAFKARISISNFILTLYHLVFIPSLGFGIFTIKKISPFGWVGAGMFTLVVGLSTYFLTHSSDNINCIFSEKNCETIVSFLYSIRNPERIVIGAELLTLFLFLPVQVVLNKLSGTKMQYWFGTQDTRARA